MKKIFASFILYIGLSSFSYGQQTPISSNPELKKLVLSGLDKMYNFKFREAEVIYKQVKAKLPGHPIYYMLMAMNMDWQWEPELTNDTLVRKMKGFLNHTVELCEELINVQKKDDAEIMFIFFTAEGFLARVNSMQGDYMSAVRNSTNAYKYVKKGFTLKEKFSDFYFSTGMYNYYRERYPELHPVIKPFAKLMDAGNAAEGIEQLKIAYKNSLFSKMESANYLVNIYFKYEGKPAEVLSTIEDVVKKYPDNLFFVYKYAEGLLQTNQTEKALPYIEKLISSSWSYYKCAGNIMMTWYNLNNNRTTEAAASIALADVLYKKMYKVNDNLHGYYYITKGKLAQAEGKNPEAKKLYNTAAKKAEYPSTMAEAKKLATGL